jgi:hypothetical protein
LRYFKKKNIKAYNYNSKSFKSKYLKMSSVEMFNASVLVSEQLNRQLLNTAQELAHRCVHECAQRYNFDAEEAIRFLGLAMVKIERKVVSKVKSVKVAKAVAPKAAFPLPYSGELNDECCFALRQNNGLYTQCTSLRKGSAEFCKGCAKQMQKTGAEVPEYGTIQMRQAVGIMEYVDPKGRKPIAYTKVMKKYKISEEKALEEAGMLSINIDPIHFVVSETDSKRGRPKTEKEPKAKGAKGRPKKSKKVLEIECDDEDLFATLVAEANNEVPEDNEEPDEIVMPKMKKGKTDEEKEAERVQKEKEKAEKEAKRLQEKADKEAKLAAEKAEKEAKKEAERLEREAKKKAEEDAKKAKEEQRLKEKAEKEAKLAAEKQAKESGKSKKQVAAKAVVEVEEDEEPDVVKKIEHEGKKYLKSKKTGIVYDYTEYVKNGEQVVVGKWNNTTNKIDFEDAEEEEEEYDD